MKHYFETVPKLSNNRLLLRGILPGDATDLIEILMYDGVPATNKTEARHILQKTEADRAKGESILWGIFLKESGEVVGLCSYHRGYPDNIGEIGYALKAAFRGQGIMTEAVQLIVEFGLNVMKLNNVVAYTSPNNVASARVLQRAGFHQVSSTDDACKFVKQSSKS